MVLKGAQKKMIVVKTGSSELFEEAYFVLKASEVRGESDMLTEANRIIEECGAYTQKNKKRAGKRPSLRLFDLLIFAVGSALGALCACLFILLL